MPSTFNGLRLLTAIIVCALLVPTGTVSAADLSASGSSLESHRVRLDYGVFRPGDSELDIPSAYKAPATHELRIIQTDGPMTTAKMRSLEMAGVQILGYIPDYNYIARLTEGQKSTVLSVPAVTWIGDFHPAYKMQQELMTQSSGMVKVVVGYHDQLFPAGNHTPLKQAIWGLGGDIFKDMPSDTMMHVELPASALPALAGSERRGEVVPDQAAHGPHQVADRCASEPPGRVGRFGHHRRGQGRRRRPDPHRLRQHDRHLWQPGCGSARYLHLRHRFL